MPDGGVRFWFWLNKLLMSRGTHTLFIHCWLTTNDHGRYVWLCSSQTNLWFPWSWPPSASSCPPWWPWSPTPLASRWSPPSDQGTSTSPPPASPRSPWKSRFSAETQLRKTILEFDSYKSCLPLKVVVFMNPYMAYKQKVDTKNFWWQRIISKTVDLFRQEVLCENWLKFLQ